jgi:transcriptional regulator with XRE-family HTH domain
MSLYLSTDTALIDRLGAKLAELRLTSGMTQAELAGAAGIGISTVREAEKGGNISLAKLIRILRALGRLELLEPFFAPMPVSPIAAAKAAQTVEKLKPRKRVRK